MYSVQVAAPSPISSRDIAVQAAAPLPSTAEAAVQVATPGPPTLEAAVQADVALLATTEAAVQVSLPTHPPPQVQQHHPVRAGQTASPLPGPYVQVRDEFCRNADLYRRLEEEDERIRKSLNEPSSRFYK